MPEVATPDSLKPHQSKYHEGAWKEYTLAELGQWVHLLAKRASHRKNAEKRAKDFDDARNYYAMMGAHLDALE